MNKKIIIGVGVVVLLVAVFFLRGKKSGSDMTKDMTGDSQESVVDTFTGTLKEAVALNTPMRCSYTVQGIEYESVVKGKKFKGSVASPDGTKSNVMMIDNCMYTWDESQGIKVCFDSDDEDLWESESTEAMAQSYVCRPASVSDSEFELPTNVEFVDMGMYMQEGGTNMPIVPEMGQ